MKFVTHPSANHCGERFKVSPSPEPLGGRKLWSRRGAGVCAVFKMEEEFLFLTMSFCQQKQITGCSPELHKKCKIYQDKLKCSNI
ncbi:hypothetical protein E2320_006000, partial [Naja naja]